ncbi:hypothetical protein G6F63_016885 [Rhizopus arrhizus]|nr:hypothetical protein G6F63_016885 [Rhizopus arrhizus]KAG1386878.1 hypothetical protein G6F58_013752 [Rhizopus delemar]
MPSNWLPEVWPAMRSPMVSALSRSAMPLAIALLVVLLLSALLTTPAPLVVNVASNSFAWNALRASENSAGTLIRPPYRCV